LKSCVLCLPSSSVNSAPSSVQDLDISFQIRKRHTSRLVGVFESKPPNIRYIIYFFGSLILIFISFSSSTGATGAEDSDTEDFQDNFISHTEFELKLDVPFKVNLKEF